MKHTCNWCEALVHEPFFYGSKNQNNTKKHAQDSNSESTPKAAVAAKMLGIRNGPKRWRGITCRCASPCWYEQLNVNRSQMMMLFSKPVWVTQATVWHLLQFARRSVRSLCARLSCRWILENATVMYFHFGCIQTITCARHTAIFHVSLAHSWWSVGCGTPSQTGHRISGASFILYDSLSIQHHFTKQLIQPVKNWLSVTSQRTPRWKELGCSRSAWVWGWGWGGTMAVNRQVVWHLKICWIQTNYHTDLSDRNSGYNSRNMWLVTFK